jgi:AcrR family transcriptional regulator
MSEHASEAESARPVESEVRSRILSEAWAMIEAGRLDDLTMAAVAAAAGVSRQTVYVQFGSRAGLLVEMVRRRDEANPRGEQVDAAIASPDPVEALVGFTRALAGWWQDIHPIAQALFAAALTDEAATAAWDDRMAHLHAFTEQVVQRLAEAGVLAHGWEPAQASDWLAAQLNPVGWVLLVQDAGWTQSDYEERMATIVQTVLVDPGARPSRSSA